MCTDEEDEEDYSHYAPELGDIKAKPKKGSAMEAVGLGFLDIHPQIKPSLALAEVHSISGFLGYLPPGEDLEEWLKQLTDET